jgi:dUTP pyrophosphatase
LEAVYPAFWKGENVAFKEIEVLITRLPHGTDLPLPQYQSIGASGCDIHAACAALIQPGQTCVVPTGLAVKIPDGWEIAFRSRSGLAANKSLSVLNSPGTLDSDYTGEIFAILHNHGTKAQMIQRGDRVGQLVIQKVTHIRWREVVSLPDTERGEGGLGSTGVGITVPPIGDRSLDEQIFGKEVVETHTIGNPREKKV